MSDNEGTNSVSSSDSSNRIKKVINLKQNKTINATSMYFKFNNFNAFTSIIDIKTIFNKILEATKKLLSENLLQNRNEIKKKLRKGYFSPQNKVSNLMEVYSNTLKRTSKAPSPSKLRFYNTYNTHNTINTYNTYAISPQKRNNKRELRRPT